MFPLLSIENSLIVTNFKNYHFKSMKSLIFTSKKKTPLVITTTKTRLMTYNFSKRLLKSDLFCIFKITEDVLHDRKLNCIMYLFILHYVTKSPGIVNQLLSIFSLCCLKTKAIIAL